MRTKTSMSWHKRMIFNAVMFVCAWAIVELTSLIVMEFNEGSVEYISIKRRKTEQSDPNVPGGYEFATPTTLHPYIGFVQSAKYDHGGGGKYPISEFGFADEGSPIHKRSPDRVIVAIVGGSVARQLSANATDVLAEELLKCPEFAGRAFQFVRLAQNGYRQPQQLMTINYMMSQGAEFDVVINLDGFNEVTSPRIDNIPYGVNSSYPREWTKLISVAARPEYLRNIGHITYLREKMRSRARWMGSFPFVYSPTVQLIWNSFHERLQRQVIELQEKSTILERTNPKWSNSGPKEEFSTQHDIDLRCIETWQRSSIVLDRMCKGNGIRYFHFLQPNRYVPHSKPIGPAEARAAVPADHPMRIAVETCYPVMRTESSQFLTAAGVAFSDLTEIFADHPEPIYNDFIGHVEKAGDVMIAKAIATQIQKFMNP